MRGTAEGFGTGGGVGTESSSLSDDDIESEEYESSTSAANFKSRAAVAAPTLEIVGGAISAFGAAETGLDGLALKSSFLNGFFTLFETAATTGGETGGLLTSEGGRGGRRRDRESWWRFRVLPRPRDETE